MKHIHCFLLLVIAFPLTGLSQFTPVDQTPFTIIVTDGTISNKDSPVKKAAGPAGTPVAYSDPIRSLGMRETIQAGAFLERPLYGKKGFLLVFTVGDSIGGMQGSLVVNGTEVRGVYRLIRQKLNSSEIVPKGMTTYILEGTIYFLGIS